RARALRARDRGHHGRRARARRPRLPRRREPERDHGHREARRHGRGRDAVQPAQDVLDPARRGRPGRGPGRGARAARGLPAGAAARAPRRRLRVDRGRAQERGTPAGVLRQLRYPGACACLPRPPRRPRPGGGDAARRLERQLPARASARDLPPPVRDALAARMRLLRPQPPGLRRPHARRRQAPARLRLLRAHHLLPAGGEGRPHDRADRDRDQGDTRPVRRRHARDRRGGTHRPRSRARGPALDAPRPPRRDPRRAPAGAALVARAIFESWRIRLSFVDFAAARRYPARSVSVLNTKVLVLNRSYLPIHITVVRRALSLLYQGIARAVDEQYRTFDFASWADLAVEEDRIGLVDRAIRVPRVILLQGYD